MVAEELVRDALLPATWPPVPDTQGQGDGDHDSAGEDSADDQLMAAQDDDILPSDVDSAIDGAGSEGLQEALPRRPWLRSGRVQTRWSSRQWRRSKPIAPHPHQSKYDEQGFLLLPKFFTPREVGALRSEMDRLLAQAPTDPMHSTNALVLDAQLTKLDYDKLDLSRRLGFHFDRGTPSVPGALPQHQPSREAPDTFIPRSIINVFYESDVLQRLVFHPRLVDQVLTPVLGEEIRFYNSRCFLKPPRGLGTAWHRDIEFFDADPNPIINVLVFLDDQTLENGCLRVIPRSHLSAPRGRLDLQAEFPELLVSEQWEKGYSGPLPGEVAMACPAGSLLLVDHFTLHGSSDNMAASTRRMISLGYADVAQTRAGDVPRSILVRGQRQPNEQGDYTSHVCRTQSFGAPVDV
ncbi:uncharacterized protein MONBRDRAFT_37877 [Monosiga brevicollis MX1]|uniref:Phytanoyl-CoA dioxygenase n=1 Tax=Monosiga brevicollis TaxID=81824 RepID=A9V4D4_MONBE|nr:uncharacterized protein MONBRDRAFT_37877 [Monosiga brevicollis MX1]EDQ87689.1 predicted protein [Monosiga brevicollis MX1]|eukprot:XP_001747609.1 hypothetical protein [Monosiga brevicollis MX1]